MQAVVLLLDGARGQYIPRDFAELINVEHFDTIAEDDIAIIRDPEHEHYWQAWQDIVDMASYTNDDGDVYRLCHDGDLWLICYERMTDEEKRNFDFDLE